MKTVTLKVRVTPEQRDAWTKASLKAGAESLSDFIRATIDEEIQWVAVSFEDTKTFLDSLSMTPEEQAEAQSKVISDFVGEDLKASLDFIATNVADPGPGDPIEDLQRVAVCPRKFTHVMGVYCTACGQTPA